ncbi:MAG: ABC transporter permease subunit [Betaproteobacteria bacterium]|nr:ABC transporter permease subunit [Betaproteobacteria bacterium]
MSPARGARRHFDVAATPIDTLPLAGQLPRRRRLPWIDPFHRTDRNLLDVARSLDASPAQIYWKVRLPAALPFIIAGLRLGVARALVGVVPPRVAARPRRFSSSTD